MKFSVITVCRNSEKFIKKTMDSVLNQTYQDFEYIIIDGASTDNTLNIIKSYDQSKIKLLSEKDTGIYNAMNKGIDLASGDYCIFMNSGDYFYSQYILEKVNNYICDDIDVYYGDVELQYKNKKKITISPNEKELNFNNKMPICHQSTFIKTRLCKLIKYNENYSSASDYDLLFKLFFNDYSFKKINLVICKYEYFGYSIKKASDNLNEFFQIRVKYSNNRMILKDKIKKMMSNYLPFILDCLINIKRRIEIIFW